MRTRAVVAVAGLALALASCAGRNPVESSATPPGMGLDGFLTAMNDRGLSVVVGDPISQPFFPVPGRTVRIAGEPVQAFEYPDAISAQLVASQVSADGTMIRNYSVSWAAPPHIYRRDRLMALYVGHHDHTHQVDVHAHLEAVLGHQIGGH